METLTNLDVSVEMMEAAEKYADQHEGWLTPGWITRYNSFLAGAFYMKPSQHSQQELKPINGYEKQSNEGNEI